MADVSLAVLKSLGSLLKFLVDVMARVRLYNDRADQSSSHKSEELHIEKSGRMSSFHRDKVR